MKLIDLCLIHATGQGERSMICFVQ